jgi:thiamine pyrophosphate-dependent acetolactate synthase large subunit-like protein
MTPDGTFLGRSGGEGLGYGLPASLGAALAGARDPDGAATPVVVDIQADGDLLYTSSALWTAASSNLPLLIVVHNNGTYGKDELHQVEVGATRGRPGDRTHIGIRIDRPRVDFAMLARAQGIEALGPISTTADLEAALEHGVQVVRKERRPILLDVVCSS